MIFDCFRISYVNTYPLSHYESLIYLVIFGDIVITAVTDIEILSPLIY